MEKVLDRILIVEDDANLARILKLYFEEKNVLCTFVENAKQAMNWIENFNPHLIIIDIGLPDIDGIELAKNIRKNIKTKKIPIIIITGKDETEFKIKSATEAKAELFPTKPFEPSILWEAATKFIENYKNAKFGSLFKHSFQ